MASIEADEKHIAHATLHDEGVEEAGHIANQEDHEETVWQALTNHTAAVMWCVYAIFVLVITSFDNQVGGVVIGIPAFRKDFGYAYEGDYVLPAQWQSAYSGGPVAAAVFGTLASGYIADRIGRKLTYLITFIIVFIGITVETIAKTNPVFFAGKFINGLAVGGFITVSMTYIGEVSPLALRGIATAAAAIAFTVGPFIVALITNTYGTLPNAWAYRGIFVAQYGISGMGAIMLPFMPESPWWLISQGKDEKAARALRRLGQSPEEVTKRIAYIQLTLSAIAKETEGVTYLECFRASNLRRTMVAIAPLSIQALSGVFFVAAYSTYYWQLAGYSSATSFRLAVCQQVMSMVGNICSWFIIDRVGRRNLTFYGMIVLTINLLITGGLACVNKPSFITGTVALMLIYCFIYNATIGATAYSAISEIATSRLRAKTASIGLALQNALFTMWGFVTPYIFNPDHANLGAKTSFIFGALAILSTVYIYFCHPEVAGRSYEEIDEMFVKRVPAKEFKNFRPEAKIKGEQARRRSSTGEAVY